MNMEDQGLEVQVPMWLVSSPKFQSGVVVVRLQQTCSKKLPEKQTCGEIKILQ